MKRCEHLESWELILTVRSPLFIGSGKKYQKIEYILNPRTGKAIFLDMERFMRFMVRRGFVDQYERFVLNRGQNLSVLFDQCGITDAEIKEMTRCEIDAGSALDERHALMDTWSFMRDKRGRAYVPGSSLKGALRTVILTSLILDHPPQHPGGEIPEWQYLNTLHLNTRKTEDAVNDILRGIQVSDSGYIADDCMTLCRKRDLLLPGFRRDRDISSPNVCRECVRPGTQLRFVLTLDHSVLKGSITKETLLKMITRFSNYYFEQYIMQFDLPENDSGEQFECCLILGGGAGFFSKTVVYPYDGERALSSVSNQMTRSFKQHGHERDIQHGLSPHTLKYTEYEGKMYHFGVCGVEFR